MKHPPNFAVLLTLFTMMCFSYMPANAQRVKPKIGSKIVKDKSAAPVPIPSTEFPQLGALETEILSELNLARSDPKSYAHFLEEMRSHFSGTELRRPNRPALKTIEGTKAVDTAIAFLKSVKPLPKLTISKGLTLAARYHLKDMQESGKSGHIGSDGLDPDARIKKFVNHLGESAEIIKYFEKTAREIVIGIIVDDGVPQRLHRNNLFSSRFLKTGLASGESRAFEQLTVIVFANDFYEKK